VYKLHCDSSYLHGVVYIGVVLKKNENIVHSSIHSIKSKSSVHAELHAIKYGIEVLNELDIKSSTILSDSLNSINLLNYNAKRRKRYKQILYEIRKQSEGLKLSFKWIPRAENEIADLVTKKAKRIFTCK
jgi:ribonuclease HI